MQVAQLRADNFRLFETLSLRPHRRLNFVVGPNAAGKTSLLETVYCLGRGKSFRGSSPADLAGAAGRRWRVAGEQAPDGAPATRLSVSWEAGETRMRAGGEEVRALDLVQRLPVQILEPGMHRLLQDGPSYRRSFLDWGVFHVEQGFHPAWRRFQRALRQRNQALRQGSAAREVQAWEPELASAGELLQAQRAAHLEQIRGRVGARVAELLGEGRWSFELQPGWPAEQGYAAVLARQRERDRRLGATLEGPQRAELRIRLDQKSARHRISRGQQKLLIAAMLLGQAEEIGATTGVQPILLIDDFAAELGEVFQQRFLRTLQAYPGQVFVTAFAPPAGLDGLADCTMFHVEQGRLQGV